MRGFKVTKGKINWIWRNQLKNSRKGRWIWKWKVKKETNNWIKVAVVLIRIFTQKIRLRQQLKITIVLWNHKENKVKLNRKTILMNTIRITSRRNIKIIKMRTLKLKDPKNNLKKPCHLLHLKRFKTKENRK